MLNHVRILLLLFLLSFSSNAFEIGTGAEYRFTSDLRTSKLDIYVADSKFNKLNIEYYFYSQEGIQKIKLWQQFELSLNQNRLIGIRKGYIYSPELPSPQILTQKYYSGKKGIQLNSFLGVNKEDIEEYRIGIENIEVPAGSIRAIHYRQKEGNQTIDYWISDLVKPIGLVKLISKDDSSKNNCYTIEMQSLLKNVKAKIKPSEATRLNALGESLFGTK